MLALVVSLGARIVNRASARRRARRTEKILRHRVEDVAAARVIAPVDAELGAHDGLCRALAAAGAPAATTRRRNRVATVP
jgi:hypothetical protein